ncbi:glyceraldehyde-3-phosphate dehydrogenase [Bermanella marisrubri]|uniref:Glyceraldehyde-3-phosphate dehydrogenase n=1 Tax=Bermanella marisrubri TaxID=207949 RepID=Q1N538_9GAMM|nr:glyceraldehyde-3-phosphate dehydrogenase [Bermanella marisrubri]EAT13240.1 glyceraldehyde-3-phosphate dehydrogenase, type I [Oceanobacter sp. RED65] [Bermanella marisrubri]QIZ84008.1 glyceraldehyde-3-phosphate dehydrogenase [Bermanella marisrubri]
MSQDVREACLNDWKLREETAEAMIPLVGGLYRKNNVVLSVYGRPIINRSVIDIIKAHRFVRQVEKEELSVQDTLPVLKVLVDCGVANCHIDIGKMAIQFREEGQGQSLDDFVKGQLEQVVEQAKSAQDGKDVVLYGFGRIGRLLARIMVEKAGGGQSMRLRAIVVRKGKGNDLMKRASLLRRDSIHGSFKGTIQVDEENTALIVNGTYIQIIYANSPSEIDYTQYGINDALVIDNTGVWRDAEGLGQHAACKGVAKVLLTAPGKGDLKNIVYGVNHGDIEESDNILSAASCTTNAITPVLKALNDEYGIEGGHVETVHSYTNDQNLIDNYHKGDRRGRAAALNMVITETGAAKAVSKALPELEGKLTGNAIRVPTPNVSMAILSLTLNKEVSKDDLNDYLREVSLHSSLQKQIDYVHSPEVVSSDFVGNRCAGIVDGEATIVSGNRVNVYVWYDNEYGYSRQVVRIAQQLCNVYYPTYPWVEK